MRAAAADPDGLSVRVAFVFGPTLIIAGLLRLGNVVAEPVERGGPLFAAGIFLLLLLSAVMFAPRRSLRRHLARPSRRPRGRLQPARKGIVPIDARQALALPLSNGSDSDT